MIYRRYDSNADDAENSCDNGDIDIGHISITGMDATNLKDTWPTMIFTLQGIDNGPPVTVQMPYRSYLESVGGDKYQLSVFATESDGAVLGANFMTGNNVIFDSENNRIGFSISDCNYQSVKPVGTRKMILAC